MKSHVLTALIALVFGFAGAALWSFTGLGHGSTRAYLIDNPEILPEMAEAYQRGEAQDRLAGVADEVRDGFPGAVLGNPQGTKVLVKFTDYGCTYCRQSVEALDQLVAADPDLKVVVREWPIFDGSEQAARMGLAAARQGKYAEYYHAMFDLGRPTPENIARASEIAGLDIPAAEKFAASGEASAQIAETMALARSLGFSGTPSFVAGNEVIEGLVPYERLREALDAEG